MTGEGSYNNLIREAGATTAAADGVTSALQRSRMAREAGSVWCSGAMRYPPPTRGWQAANTRRRRQTSGPQTSSPNLTPETAPPGPTPGLPIASTSRGRRGNALLAQQEAASRRNVELEADMEKSKDLRSRRGRKEFYTSAKQNEEIEAGILTFKEPSPDRGPIIQAPFGPGDETDAPYESDSGDYLDRDSFCTRRGSKIHSPRRKRKDRKDH